MALKQGVLSRLSLEVVFGLAKLDACLFCDEGDGFLRKVRMAIQASANGCSAQCEFVDGFECLMCPVYGPGKLHGVAPEFLSQTNRGCIHEVGSPDLEHFVKLGSFRLKAVAECRQGWKQVLLESDASGNMHGSREGVIR